MRNVLDPRIERRRCKVLELSGQGHGQPKIFRILQAGQGIVNSSHISYLRASA